MLSLVAAVLVAQGNAAPKSALTPQRLDAMGIARTRKSFADVKRDWVRPDTLSYRFQQSLAELPPYSNLNAQLVSNIDAAGIPVDAQGSRGTCTIFATMFLAEYELARQADFKSSEHLNPEYLNWAANAATNDNGDGSSFPAVVAGLGKYGCSNWSDPKVYSGVKADFKPDYKPSNAILTKAEALKKRVALLQIFSDQSHVISDEHMKLILDLLDEGYPVAVGQQWPADGAWKSTKVNGYTILEGTGAVAGAHTMPIVGYKKSPKSPGGGYFLFRNSWGEGWGTKGYHFMSFDWVKNHTYDACIAVNANWTM